MEEKFNTPNDLNLKVTGVNNQELINEDCCTCINIILQNDGNIQTSFLGAHNPQIINCLEKAMKMYFKGIKKTLKHQFAELDECEDDCCCGEHECGCGDDCNCDDTCTCDDKCDCHEEKSANQHDCCHDRKGKSGNKVKTGKKTK